LKTKIIEEINKLLENTKQSLTLTYVEIFNKTIKHYGKNTLILIEVGSFYEIYCPYEKGDLYNIIVDISKITDVQLTRKNTKIKEINEKNPYLLGFNNLSKNKYIKKIMNTGKYNVIIISQKGNSKEKNVKRYVETILSEGTDINNQKEEENFILSLNIEKTDDLYATGIAYVDLRTGKNYISEYYGTKEDSYKALDAIIDTIFNFNISNVLINLDKYSDENFIINYLELKNNYHIRHEKRKLEYKNELLNKIFSIETFLTPIEEIGLAKMPLGLDSYIFLLEHIIDFEAKLLNDLPYPIILNDNNFMYIGNNGLEQLNIISNDKSLNVLDILNKCSTSFGKRYFKERLLKPIKNKEELERRYNLSETFKENYEDIIKDLQQIYDIEKITRKLQTNYINPYEIANLYFSLQAIIKNEILIPYKTEEKHIKENINKILYLIENTFLIADCQRFNRENITENLLKKDINPELSNFNQITEQIKENIENFVLNINKYFKVKDFITLQYNERDGFYFLITKTRYRILEKEKDKLFFDLAKERIFLKDFKYNKRTSNIKMEHPVIKELSEKYLLSLNKIILINKEFFNLKIKPLFKNYIKTLKDLIIHIADIDIAVTNIKNTVMYNYTKPIILKNKEQQILMVKDLRHLIIERVLEKNEYIPNDINIGYCINEEICQKWQTDKENINGILLFGLNSSGKSSIQKSLGIALILAQAGMYVPATVFKYTIYEELFTRIVSKDNPDRGLSTFAVEMLELKNIFLRGTSKSLVLGDEICHGTETFSGVSIVAGAIKYLSEKNINFLFATHLHQLIELEEIKKLNNIVFLHLEITKDNNGDLIYNRKLQPGSGSNIYGLEFAKSLNMNKQFLKYADDFLNNISNHNDEKLLRNNKNKYNNKLYSTKCILCNKPAETHHIKEQNKADKNNLINGKHKNHLSNLISLCKFHHEKVHKIMKENDLEGEDLFRYVMTSKGVKLIINPLLKD